MTSTPQSEFDEWFSDTHGGTKKQPIESEVTDDECEYDEMDDELCE